MWDNNVLKRPAVLFSLMKIIGMKFWFFFKLEDTPKSQTKSRDPEGTGDEVVVESGPVPLTSGAGVEDEEEEDEDEDYRKASSLFSREVDGTKLSTTSLGRGIPRKWFLNKLWPQAPCMGETVSSINLFFILFYFRVRWLRRVRRRRWWILLISPLHWSQRTLPVTQAHTL